jgi:hypothetical protein
MVTSLFTNVSRSWLEVRSQLMRRVVSSRGKSDIK